MEPQSVHLARSRIASTSSPPQLGQRGAIGFCHEIGLDYISCSPFRVPIARLAAAHAALADKGKALSADK